MKIYFEDGFLNNYLEECPTAINVDASMGVTAVYNWLDKLKKDNRPAYTNATMALNGDYAWNEELGYHEIYIRDLLGDWHLIKEFTPKELRKAHNIERMYRAGAFTR